MFCLKLYTVQSLSALAEERSRTLFHGAGHIPWTTSWVPLNDGCKSPTKIRRTSFCGCVFFATTSIGSKRRLKSEETTLVAIPSCYCFSFYSCLILIHSFHARSTGCINHVRCMHSRDQRLNPLALFVMMEFPWLHWWTDLPWEATQTGSDELRDIFESHLVEAGHMLVLLDTIVSGAYLTEDMEVRDMWDHVTVTVWVNVAEDACKMCELSP